jgi:predicted P-loop ATPase
LTDARLIQSLPSSGRIAPMIKHSTAEVHRQIAERQLFDARRTLRHLVEMFDNGQWRLLYREETFAEAVREARQAVDHWTDVIAKFERS